MDQDQLAPGQGKAFTFTEISEGYVCPFAALH